MRVWLVTVIFLFAASELYQWIKGFTLPFPIYVIAGAFLAIASNSEEGFGSGFTFNPVKSNNTIIQTATLVDSLQALDGDRTNVE